MDNRYLGEDTAAIRALLHEIRTLLLALLVSNEGKAQTPRLIAIARQMVDTEFP